MWSQQSNFSWQAPIPGNLAPQFHNHSCFYPHQQYQEEPPSPKQSTLEETMAALKDASARLEKSMSAFLSQAEEDRQSLERTNNSNMQSFETMDAHSSKKKSVKVSWQPIIMSTTWRMSALTIMSKLSN
jgi:hypothetical protein